MSICVTAVPSLNSEGRAGQVALYLIHNQEFFPDQVHYAQEPEQSTSKARLATQNHLQKKET